jgi:hypothetical protein
MHVYFGHAVLASYRCHRELAIKFAFYMIRLTKEASLYVEILGVLVQKSEPKNKGVFDQHKSGH